eukprot:scaffold1377_cov198-Ochromonas_danica.AAC.10
MAKKRNEARRLERTIKRNQEQLEEAVDELKDNVLHFDDEEEDKVIGGGTSKKSWVHRPEHWRSIVEFYRLAKDVRDVQTEFSELFEDLSEMQPCIVASHLSPQTVLKIPFHTESHWQTPISYMRYIQQVLVPFRDKAIIRLGLPSNQYAILKHDLHYSHKDPDVLALLKLRCFVSLFVPAGCTDLIQECDLW